MSTFQNEEGIPLVEEGLQQEQPEQSSISLGKKAALAVVAMGVLAGTAYVSFMYGVNNGMKAAASPMAMNKKTLFPFTGVHEPLPNDSNGPSTNEDALKSVVSGKLDKYGYLKDKHFEGEFSSYGHGMAQDASPIPDDPDYEGDDSKVKITLNFNDDGGVFKEYMHEGVKYVDKLGKISGLNKEDDIVFADGDSLERDGHSDRQFGILQVICGYTEHIADFHVHSGWDNRVTLHTPDACPLEMDTPYVCDYDGIWEGHDQDMGFDYQCKCDGDIEMCKCLADGPDHAWCQQWFDINAFMNDHPQDEDDEHHDDEEDDMDDHAKALPEEAPAVMLNEVAAKKGNKLSKFNEMDVDYQKKASKFLAKKLKDQQKLQKRTRGNRGKK